MEVRRVGLFIRLALSVAYLFIYPEKLRTFSWALLKIGQTSINISSICILLSGANACDFCETPDQSHEGDLIGERKSSNASLLNGAHVSSCLDYTCVARNGNVDRNRVPKFGSSAKKRPAVGFQERQRGREDEEEHPAPSPFLRLHYSSRAVERLWNVGPANAEWKADESRTEISWQVEASKSTICAFGALDFVYGRVAKRYHGWR